MSDSFPSTDRAATTGAGPAIAGGPPVRDRSKAPSLLAQWVIHLLTAVPAAWRGGRVRARGEQRLPAQGQLAPCRDGVILLVGKGSNGPTGSQLRRRALPENVSMVRSISGRVPGSVIHVGLGYIDLRPSHKIE